MALDVAHVRGLYPSLSGGWIYLNAHQSPQLPEAVVAAVGRAFRTSAGIAVAEGGGSHSRSGAESDALIDAARVAVADVVGARRTQVVLGPSIEALYAQLWQAMAPLRRRGSAVVLSRLDPPSITGAFSDAEHVAWAEPDLGTGFVPAWQYSRLVDGSTRLVVFSAAHAQLGTVAPIRDIVAETKATSRAWTLVDCTPLVGYRGVDFDELGADIISVDFARLGGPQLAALVLRDERMITRLAALPTNPGAEGVAKLETPISAGLAGGLPAVVDHYASLLGEETGKRRRRLEASMEAVADHSGELLEALISQLGSLPSVHIFGVTGEAGDGGAGDRIPVLSFAVRGASAAVVHQRLVANGILTSVAPTSALLDEMGAEEVGGAVTVSLSPFSTRADIDELVRVVASLG